jgi:uncharacterized membrane protein YesL
VQTLRLVGRGLSDTLEHLLPFALLSLAWWLGVLLILPAPAATVALLAMTDPRRAVDRPDWREAVSAGRAAFWPAWGLALLTLPVVAVLAANLAYYGARASRWGVLIPLWLILFLLALAITLQAFAVAGLTAQRPLAAAKQAAFLALLRPGRSLALVAVAALFVLLGSALVVPLILIVPALLAAVTARFTLTTLGFPIPDPLAPTEERTAELHRPTT